jgi:hypothetical protein
MPNNSCRQKVSNATCRARTQIIGTSIEGRDIVARSYGEGEKRLLFVGSQHGDEPLAYEVLQAFALSLPLNIQLAVIPSLNPDGLAKAQRLNASGVDLNRDHQLLSSPETKALHQFVRTFRPHLVVDVHTYPPRRSVLLEQDFLLCHDVMLDVPTTPSLEPNVRQKMQTELLEPLLDNLNQAFKATRYMLFSKTRVRHSTPDSCWLLNASALRYGCWTLVLEGYKTALESAGISFDPALVLGIPEHLYSEQAYAAMKPFLAKKPPGFSVVFCANDLIAIGVLHALQEAGRRVPEDVLSHSLVMTIFQWLHFSPRPSQPCELNTKN